jgi:transposase
VNTTELTSEAKPVPNPEVTPTRAVRRHFKAEEKLRILNEADKCAGGELGALLRREGLFSSHLSTWRKQRDAGELAGLTPRKRGRKANPDRALVAENEKLKRDVVRLQKRIEQAELIISVQKKVSQLLGHPIEGVGNGEVNS